MRASARAEIEPRPGGAFREVFDEEGNGVLHARVTWAERGKKLVFRGPLGLHGRAFDQVHTVTFEPEGPAGERTLVRVEVRGFGEVEPGLESVVERVWQHFLERYRAHVERLAAGPR